MIFVIKRGEMYCREAMGRSVLVDADPYTADLAQGLTQQELEKRLANADCDFARADYADSYALCLCEKEEAAARWNALRSEVERRDMGVLFAVKGQQEGVFGDE